MAAPDIIDNASGLAPDAPIALLRRQRPDFVRYGQGSYEALIAPTELLGLSLIERAAAALRVATIERDAALITHYRRRLAEVGALPAIIASVGQDGSASSLPPRLTAILSHVSRVTTVPGSATRIHLDALRDVGLAPRDIVAITQIVAFVSYQVRVVAGLSLLDQEQRA